MVRTLLAIVLVAPASWAQLIPMRPEVEASLPPRINDLRFSPDGRHFLAVLDSRIAVFTVNPFQEVLTLPAAGVRAAGFVGGDEKQVFAFVAGGEFRLLHWSLASGQPLASTPLPATSCETFSAAPDAAFLACLDTEGNFRLIRTRDAHVEFERARLRRKIKRAPFEDPPPQLDLPFAGHLLFCFSPDSRYLCAQPEIGAALALDLRTMRSLSLAGALRMRPGESAAFLSSELLLIGGRPGLMGLLADARVVAFPSGRVLATPRVPAGPLRAATGAGFALAAPVMSYIDFQEDKFRAALWESATGRTITGESLALDVFGPHYVAETQPGELGLFVLGKGRQARLRIH